MSGNDLNPQPNKYAVIIGWGKNVKSSDGTSAFFQEFDAYKIIIVDALGAQVGAPANGNMVSVKAETESTKNCCSATEYSTTVSGDEWPAGGERFMIVPYSEWKENSTKKSFTMPIGSVTSAFTDKTEGTANLVKVAPIFEMSEQGAKDLMALPKADLYEIARATVYAGVAAKGVSLNNIIVTNVELISPTARRLGSTRRLASHTKFGIKITTEILLDDSYTGAAINTAAFEEPAAQAAMTTALVKKSNEKGVASVTADTVTVNQASLAVTAEDVSVATPVTGAAQPMAGTLFSTIIALAMALAGRQLLA
jgi:hypothetical protein